MDFSPQSPQRTTHSTHRTFLQRIIARQNRLREKESREKVIVNSQLGEVIKELQARRAALDKAETIERQTAQAKMNRELQRLNEQVYQLDQEQAHQITKALQPAQHARDSRHAAG